MSNDPMQMAWDRYEQQINRLGSKMKAQMKEVFMAGYFMAIEDASRRTNDLMYKSSEIYYTACRDASEIKRG